MKINKVVILLFIISSMAVSLYFTDIFAQDEEGEAKGMPGAEVIKALGKPIQALIKPAGPENIKTSVYTTKTKDKWEISIDRYNAKDLESTQYKGAVVLCHGFNFNSNFWNIDSRCSLANYLAENGYDVWVPSLRGSGSSSKPLLSRFRSIAKFELKTIPQMFIKGPFDIAKFGWTIDDHISQDVPAIIDFVKKKSGFNKIYWIGHSMGGIVMFGYLETEGQGDIAGFIPVGSMMAIPQPLTPHLETIANQKPLLTASLLVNTTVASQFRNFTLGTVKHPIEELLFERDNMYNDVMFRFFRLCVDDTSAGVVTQFSDSIRKGEISSKDGRYSYTDNMRLIKVPMLIIGGSKDGFVSEKELKVSYDMVSSRDKSLVVFSKANGYLTDYGHCDLILGKNSKAEVYPVILSWLDERTRERWWKKLPIMRQQ
jgi:polyhydroxyalkanoate synthase